MCGRYNLRATPHQLAEAFALFREPEWAPRYNIAPTQLIGAVRCSVDEPRTWGALRWGLIPSWSKDATGAARLINARSETADEKPPFRTPFRRQRCLIPANGYYEWAKESEAAAPKRSKKEPKRPYSISLRDGSLMAFAGLWDRWKHPSGEVWETATILTTDASPEIAHLHDRMPVILWPQDFDLWLDPKVQDVDALRGLLVPYPAERLDVVAVSTVVNNVRNETPECLAPAAPESSRGAAPRVRTLFD